MNSERELFEKEYRRVQMIKDKGDIFERYPNGDYVRHSLQLAWLMWQASTQRQGYKLVPVEPEFKTLQKMNEVLTENYSETPKYRMQQVYKAMIGAV